MFRLLVLNIFILPQVINSGQSAWNSYDESSWPSDQCKEGAGRRQSPIDIRTGDVIKDFSRQFIKYGSLKFGGYKTVLVSGINNGHTIQFSSEGEESIHPILTGGPLEHPYRLEQVHFRWLSEHSVDGFKAICLCRAEILNLCENAKHVQEELEDNQLESTQELMQYIPRLKQAGDRISGVLLDITKLLSPDQHNYYTYSGSLTSPECNEAVTWIIFETPVYISYALYRLFEKLGVGLYNFRSLQKLDRHVVFSPPLTRINTPKIIVFFDNVAKLFAGFLKNITTFMAKGYESR